MSPSKSSMECLPARFQPTHLVVHYNEVALKGGNRAWFEEMLRRNIRSALTRTAEPPAEPAVEPLAQSAASAPAAVEVPVEAAMPEDRGASAATSSCGQAPVVRRLFGRIKVEVPRAMEWRQAIRSLQRVFGIAYVLPVVELEPDIEALARSVGETVRGEQGSRTFAVVCKRSTKSFPFTSMDVARAVGGRVHELTGWPVDLEAPDLRIQIELVNKSAFVGFGRADGPGGLPTGVSGKVACLLSGGIDSPVAAYRMLRRGAIAVYVHFHSHPYTGAESQEKARELVRAIHPAGWRTRLYLVPFAELQRKIAARCPAPLRVILYRRFMVRCAEALARREGALALVTGENLGQVASQTLENLRTIDSATSLPVLRPLIGMDKQEIVEEARRIGTFETSIEPHGDCCSFLMPPHPATSTSVSSLDEAEAALDVDAEVAALVDAAGAEDMLGIAEGKAGAGSTGQRSPAGGRPRRQRDP